MSNYHLDKFYSIRYLVSRLRLLKKKIQLKDFYLNYYCYYYIFEKTAYYIFNLIDKSDLNKLSGSISFFIDFKGILWVPLAWLTTTIFLASFFLGDNSGKDFRIKFFILSLQFFPFSILCFSGWDYGRWIFVWIVSSILIYCTFGEELKSYKPIQKNLFRYDLIKEFCFNIEIHKRSKILLAIFAYPHCCWSLFYLPSLLVIPSYSILKKSKLFFK